ncbi:hypothetical protein BDW02DRAFT_648020 [Decorospora gaudefroyi]|uniref:Aminoglycoside phosphotransferase domain-containing protein n=1 Tax=Decorospora gaudefroyi TaxID=184978 RepID=A0A6A5KEN8_9PLEO|nr:hypothetical protein BDW02DRAFT_648020 [Decorospora gaudefroyi]
MRLGAVWHHLAWEKKLAIVDQVAGFDGALSAIRFKTHGCIYFKEDLQRLTGISDPIGLITSDQQHSTLEQYSMGPLTKAELWVSGRDQLDIDRGPWQNPEAYARALGANEVSWIRKHAKRRMNHYLSSKHPELPDDALELLAKYDQVASFLVPSTNHESATTNNTLWHPDLHLDNVFVDPLSHKITGIVDWQSATVAPLFYQSGIHRAFRHYKSVQEGWVVPQKPENFETLDPSEQQQIESDLQSEKIHKYYELQTMKHAPPHWHVLQKSSVYTLRKPVWLVTGVWENRDTFFLRDSLIAIVAQWNEIFGEDVPCPITFSTEELELHANEEENMDGIGQMLSLLQAQGILPADSMVAPEDYQTSIENCDKYKEVFLNAAESEEERDLYAKLWPYLDDLE